MRLRSSLSLAFLLPCTLCGPAFAASFGVNGQLYDVAAIAGTGSNKALLELDFGTNASPDVHLFGYQWDTGTPNGRTMLSDLQAASTGVTFADTYFASFGSYLLNTLWYDTTQPADDYPNAFWLWFTGPDGKTWNQADLGYDATALADNGFYAWALQHDDPNMNHDWSNPDAPFLPPSHLPAAISAVAVPEAASLALLLPAATLLMRRRR